MLKGKMEFRLGSEQRVCGQGDVIVIPGGAEHEGWFLRRQRGDRFLSAAARGLPTRGRTCLHERRLNSSLACSICSTGSAAMRSVGYLFTDAGSARKSLPASSSRRSTSVNLELIV